MSSDIRHRIYKHSEITDGMWQNTTGKSITVTTKDWLGFMEKHYLEFSIGTFSYGYETELTKMIFLCIIIKCFKNQT